MEVVEAHVVQGLEFPGDVGGIGEEFERLPHLHIEKLGDILALPANLERVLGKPRAAQTSQVTHTSARKSMSSRVEPWPSQASHRPPATLKLNRPAFQPRFFASGSIVKSLRMSSQTFT